MHVPRGIAGGALRVALPGSRSGIPLLVRRGGYFQLNRRSDSSSPSSPAPRRWRATYSSAATSSPSSQNAVAASAAAPSESTLSSTPPNIPETVTINSKTHPTDAHFNISSAVLALTSRRLHLQKDHPVQITRQIIESVFPESVYSRYNEFDPVVSAAENFDSLGFPADHPGRSRTDTYYVNSSTLLRTHTSAHEAQLFRSNTSPGYLISADVYRRDEVDRSHYPVFHQMEGARVWDRSKVPGGDVAAAVRQDLERLGKHDMRVEDPNPPFHEERNPRQEKHHSAEEARLVGEHLKRSLELVVNEIFTRVKKAGAGAGGTEQNAGVDDDGEPLRVRWVEAYFPFTSPSWELEVWYQGEWLEVLGCGVSQQQILIDAGVPDQIGWAFGLGLERIAMLLFRIPDIRLFWSRDERFLGQFSGVSDDLGKLKAFVPFSKHPACYKDASFWLADQTKEEWHENDLMEVVRDVCGDVVEDVKCTDKFTHPKTGRRSLCYRINYRSLERTLTNAETNEMHDKVTGELVKRLGVVIR